jgi:hypothetical protein
MQDNIFFSSFNFIARSALMRSHELSRSGDNSLVGVYHAEQSLVFSYRFSSKVEDCLEKVSTKILYLLLSKPLRKSVPDPQV